MMAILTHLSRRNLNNGSYNVLRLDVCTCLAHVLFDVLFVQAGKNSAAAQLRIGEKFLQDTTSQDILKSFGVLQKLCWKGICCCHDFGHIFHQST